MFANLQAIVDHRWFQGTVVTLILINAVVLGLDAWPPAAAVMGPLLDSLDTAILYFFAVEIVLRLAARGPGFFRDPWSVFDFIVVGLSFAAAGGMSALRSLRVLRILRLVSAAPSLRTVVGALLEAIPGISSVGLVLVLFLYVFAVIATNLYGATLPQYFGGLFVSMFSLFKIMTLEGWTTIADDMMAQHPYSWIFIVSFILVATFTMLNLFIGIVVSVLDHDAERQRSRLLEENQALRKEMTELNGQIARLNARIGAALGEPAEAGAPNEGAARQNPPAP